VGLIIADTALSESTPRAYGRQVPAILAGCRGRHSVPDVILGPQADKGNECSDDQIRLSLEVTGEE
jgi:hypothetical protein